MLNKMRKHSAYMVIQSEFGFTMITYLFMFTIVIITVPLISMMLRAATYAPLDDELSIYQFFNFIRDDAIAAVDMSIQDNRLYFHLISGEVAKIEQYNDLIRRQVDGEGHEIYLRDVQSFHLTPLSYGVVVRVTSLEGESYEKTIVFYD